jgi:LysR family transcriptional regulator, hydrogen peroxide-inducible genes activator
MKDRLSIRQLESLVAVADHANFRKAAAALGITQPALSSQVQLAEATLGLQVFERDRRSVLVTSAGEDVVARCRLALAAVDGVHETARNRGRPLVGELRLGVIPTVAPYWLPPLLGPLRKAFPQLRLILREEQTARLLDMLHNGLIDCAFLALPVPGDLTNATVAHEEFVIAAPRQAAIVQRDKGLQLRDLAGQSILLLEDGHCLRDQALSVCERGGAVEPLEVRATSLPTLVQMVAGGVGITLLPEAAAAALAPRRGPVGTARFARPAPGRTLGIVWRTSSARTREFRLLAETFGAAARAVVGSRDVG